MQTDDPLADAITRYGGLVEAAITRLLDRQDGPASFYGIMRYHLGLVDERFTPITAGRGKGLRGALLLLVAEAFGGDLQATAPLAAGIELLHNFSLIHDDFEDGSLVRRHRPTVWSIWGAPIGINAGDGMYALAHLALLDTPLARTAPERTIDIARRFEECVLRICEGQHLDLSFEDHAMTSVDDYLGMIEGKSAALIAAAGYIGARAVGADKPQAETAWRFGRDLGLAFQMQDDFLGIWGDEALTGKSARSDIESRKKTLPVLLALHYGREEDQERLRDLYRQPGGTADETAEILAILGRAGAGRITQEYLHRYIDDALASLADLDIPEEARRVLREVTTLFVDRTA